MTDKHCDGLVGLVNYIRIFCYSISDRFHECTRCSTALPLTQSWSRHDRLSQNEAQFIEILK